MPAEAPALPRLQRPAGRKLGIGIVHLGLGAFFRAHGAIYVAEAMASSGGEWGIVGVSLQSPTTRDQLAPQGFAYTALELGPGGETPRVVGSVLDVLVAREDPAAVLAVMADPRIRIVTLTVTEKGYRLDPATGDLLLDDADVAADLADIAAPRTAPGFIVAALRARKAAGLKPFTVISCDNLPHNGKRIRAGVIAMARQIDPSLADWIEAEGAFPQTMIDRIVPATIPDDIARLTARLGVEDQGMVKAEPFTQWVIEDRFAGERPDFAALGVQLTDAVEPWEDAKLRLLNGAHSAIAYLGALSGHEHVHEAVAVPAFRAYVEALWDEAETTLNPPPGLDIPAYRDALMARFSNAALMHRTRQIAMDGSQKLPQRLLAGAAERLAAGQGIEAMALGVAAWMKWQSGVTESGEAFVVDDPMAAKTAELLAGADNDQARVSALLSLSAVFPPALAADDRFAVAVTEAYLSLSRNGAVAAARQVVD